MIDAQYLLSDADVARFIAQGYYLVEPALPEGLNEEIANRLKVIRNEAAEALGITRGVLMSNTVILEIARIHPDSVEALAGIAGVRRWQSETLADRFLAVL